MAMVPMAMVPMAVAELQCTMQVILALRRAVSSAATLVAMASTTRGGMAVELTREDHRRGARMQAKEAAVMARPRVRQGHRNSAHQALVRPRAREGRHHLAHPALAAEGITRMAV